MAVTVSQENSAMLLWTVLETDVCVVVAARAAWKRIVLPRVLPVPHVKCLQQATAQVHSAIWTLRTSPPWRSHWQQLPETNLLWIFTPSPVRCWERLVLIL